MANKEYSPTDLDEQVAQMREAWQNMGATISLGDMTFAQFESDRADVADAQSRLQSLLDQVTAARNELKSKRYALWGRVKRVRASVKGKYGDDSTEYERFGGTRMSERKSRTRRNPPAEG